jgi:hypothetical protein
MIAPTVTPISSIRTIPRLTPSFIRQSSARSATILPQTTSKVEALPSLPPNPKFQPPEQGPVSRQDQFPSITVVWSDSQPAAFNGEDADISNAPIDPVSVIGSPETAVSNGPQNDGRTSTVAAESSITITGQIPEPSSVGGNEGGTDPTPIRPPLFSVGSAAISVNQDENFIIASETKVPNELPIARGGNRIDLEPSGSASVVNGFIVPLAQASADPAILSIDSSVTSPNAEESSVIADQHLVSGGSSITALKKSIYQPPFSSAVVIDGSTMSLVPAPPILTFGTREFEKEQASGSWTDSHSLMPEASSITTEGTRTSLRSFASTFVVDSNTIVPLAAPQVLTFGVQAFTALRDGGGIKVGSQILVPGAAPITLAGTRYSLASSASALIIGSQTLTPHLAPTTPPGVISPQATAAPRESEYVVAGQTLVPGAPPISVFGAPVSLPSGASHVIIGSSTQSLPSEPSRLASLIINGFGDIRPDPPPTTTNATAAPSESVVGFTGAAERGKSRHAETWLIWLSLGTGVVHLFMI